MSRPKRGRRTGARLRQDRAGFTPWGGLGPGCEGKRRFPTREEAERHRGPGGEMRAYRCPVCLGYHVGHGQHRRG